MEDGIIKRDNKILIGYWKSSYEPQYPDPNNLISSEFWEVFKKKHHHDKSYIANYLDECIPCNNYRGFSTCRICGEGLGTHERTDEKYIWPDKLSHYIMKHDVILPEIFLEHIINREFISFSDDSWIKWGDKKEGRKLPDAGE